MAFYTGHDQYHNDPIMAPNKQLHVPGYVVPTAAAMAAITTMVQGDDCLVTGTNSVYRYNGAWQLIGPVPSAAPSGPAGGDLTGTYPNPTLNAANGNLVSLNIPSCGFYLNTSQHNQSAAITCSGNTATYTLNGHGYTTGDWVQIQGATPGNYNGWFQITVIDANTFTYTVLFNPTSPSTGTSHVDIHLVGATSWGTNKLTSGQGASNLGISRSGTGTSTYNWLNSQSLNQVVMATGGTAGTGHTNIGVTVSSQSSSATSLVAWFNGSTTLDCDVYGLFFGVH